MVEIVHYKTLKSDIVKRLGLIILQSDLTIKDEFRYFFAHHDINFLSNRIPVENEITADNLQNMQQYLQQTMSLFPIDIEFDVMGYACTSGALYIGHQKISDIISVVRPCHFITDPLHAVVQAIKVSHVQNIAYLSPYSVSISQKMVQFLRDCGINITYCATFNEPH